MGITVIVSEPDVCVPVGEGTLLDYTSPLLRYWWVNFLFSHFSSPFSINALPSIQSSASTLINKLPFILLMPAAC